MQRIIVKSHSGGSVNITFDSTDLLITDDLLVEANKIATMLGNAAETYGYTVDQLERADARYRNWRALVSEQQLAADPKCAEHKIKTAVESKPEFKTHKDLIAKLTGDKAFLEQWIEACKIKARMIDVKSRQDNASRRAYEHQGGDAVSSDWRANMRSSNR